MSLAAAASCRSIQVRIDFTHSDSDPLRTSSIKTLSQWQYNFFYEGNPLPLRQSPAEQNPTCGSSTSLCKRDPAPHYTRANIFLRDQRSRAKCLFLSVHVALLILCVGFRSVSFCSYLCLSRCLCLCCCLFLLSRALWLKLHQNGTCAKPHFSP